jgi:cellulose synthase/poly-beta-1,6-N-acetylglucosamine synthase-like glycosyltransferase
VRALPRRADIPATRAGIAFTWVATILFASEWVGSFLASVASGRWALAAALAAVGVVAAFLIYGGLVYLHARLGYARRCLAHAAEPPEDPNALFRGDAPSLAVLVPAYREEPDVVLRTLLSAALLDYPERAVVLLIDDPPRPDSAEEFARLEAARRLPDRLRTLLAPAARRFKRAERAFFRRLRDGESVPAEEFRRLSALCVEAAAWFGMRAGESPSGDHGARFFVREVLERRRKELEDRAEEFLHLRSGDAGRIAPEFRRLATLFRAKVTSFERKVYENLSHEPNKAMNLNSYLMLMGGRYRVAEGAEGLRLEAAIDGRADLSAPDTDYVITLDADSILLPDYARKLVAFAERPGNGRYAVIQTPYSAFDGAPGACERIAGATTDIQYVVHQGFTAANATYWVGANALLRKAALRDIATTVRERGFDVRVYIQDRTVIEDTESTVDLVDRGWRLHNHPERLAYSATPPDFGSLLIQRRRWANGGLIILPKLLRYLARGPWARAKAAEALMRIHYLVSIAAVNFGLLLVLAVPFPDSAQSVWLPLTALAYYAFYARDLVLAGYRASDLLRVYALNLVLIPVNLGGVLKSMQQAWTRRKIPFGRTPKVRGRTAAAPLYILAEYAILLHWIVSASGDAWRGRWLHAGFATVNVGFLLYGIVAFVGLKESREDLLAAWHARRGARRKPAVPAAEGVPGAEAEATG